MKKFIAKYASAGLAFLAANIFIVSFKGLIGSPDAPQELLKK